MTLSRQDLEFWVFDATASRVLDSLLSSPTTPQKVKTQIIALFMGSFAKFSQDKFASHFFDKCWKVATLDQKVHFYLITFLMIRLF